MRARARNETKNLCRGARSNEETAPRTARTFERTKTKIYPRETTRKKKKNIAVSSYNLKLKYPLENENSFWRAWDFINTSEEHRHCVRIRRIVKYLSCGRGARRVVSAEVREPRK